MKEILEDGKEYLQKLKETCKREFPNYAHDIPSPASVTLANYSTIVLTSDACNQAQKSRRLAKNKIMKAHKYVEEVIFYYYYYYCY